MKICVLCGALPFLLSTFAMRQQSSGTSQSNAPAEEASSAPLPVEKEPHHHVVLENEFIRLLHVTIAPGERTLYHTHSHDAGGVDLVASTRTSQPLGEPEGPASPSQVGNVWAGSMPDGKPYTHRVHNVGDGPVDLFDIEFLQRPQGPTGAAAAAVAAENAEARVYKWVLAPGASSAMHTHERPYLILVVMPMRLKMTAPDGRSRIEDVKAGDFHWVDSKVTHTLANESSVQGQIVEFELK